MTHEEIERHREFQTRMLKRCPFCDAEPGENGPEVTGTHPGTDWVECNNCGAQGPSQKKYNRPKGAARRAAEAWNNRY